MGVYFILIIFIIFLSLVSPPFRSGRNWSNLATRIFPLFMVGLGESFVMLTGGIDISIGAQVSLSAAIASCIMGHSGASVALGITSSLIGGCLVGLLNGFAVTKFKVVPFIMTLGTMVLLQGVTFQIRWMPGGYISKEFANILLYRFGLLPLGPLSLLIIFGFLAIIILGRTPVGRDIYAVGGNEEAARLAGINTARVKIFAYILCGLFCALAGLYEGSRMQCGDPHVGDPFLMDGIMVAAVGGTSLLGGQGNPIGVIGGAIFIASLGNMFIMLDLNTFTQYIIKGFILVSCVLFSQLQARRSIE
jgi:ribose/xylose/arabinose/galactoside ABC-type transport system permease subunit